MQSRSGVQPVSRLAISGYNGCMCYEQEWVHKFGSEIANAQAARQAGNEGKARVCARRAAGLVAAEYLHRNQLPLSGPSAYDHLRRLQSLPGLPIQTAEIVERLLLRVSKDFNLPVQADLIEDTLQLKRILIGEPDGD